MSTQTCPNPECDKHNQPTTVMGGCDCGTALIPYYTRPSDDQLANFACVLIVGPGYSKSDLHFVKNMMDDMPELKASWLANHQAFQSKIRSLSETP